jgi:RNA polymerase sigma factor (sigma-70 family)
MVELSRSRLRPDGELHRSDGAVSSPAGDVAMVLNGFHELYDREQRSMVRLATLLTGSVALAEEIVQDAFAVVSDRWEELERPGAYLRTTVVNGAASVLRHREVEARYRPRLAGTSNMELPTNLIEVRDALDRLTPRQRFVVVLRYYLDLPDDEIARELEVQPSTVRSLAHRALASLREELT